MIMVTEPTSEGCVGARAIARNGRDGSASPAGAGLGDAAFAIGTGLGTQTVRDLAEGDLGGGGLGSKREPDLEQGATFGRVADRNMTVVPLDDFSDQGQAQPGALIERHDAVEGLEDGLAMLIGNAGAAVGHADRAISPYTDADRAFLAAVNYGVLD